MPLKVVNAVPVLLGDVARVEDGFAVQNNIVHVDGRRATYLTILKHELPARPGVEEVAIGGANVRARRGAGAAAQHELIAHELAVVLSDRARRRLEAWIRQVSASRPLPHVAVDLPETAAGLGAHRPEMACAKGATFQGHGACRHLPFEL